MRRKMLCPTTDLFHEGEVIDVYQLNRVGAFSQPMEFLFRRPPLRTFHDHIDLRWPNRNKPAQIILIEWTQLHFGGERPWFICYKCNRR